MPACVCVLLVGCFLCVSLATFGFCIGAVKQLLTDFSPVGCEGILELHKQAVANITISQG